MSGVLEKKRCSCCKESKLLSCFTKVVSTKKGTALLTEVSACKACARAKRISLKESKAGMKEVLYLSLRNRARLTGGIEFSKDEFLIWLKDTNYESLFETWRSNGFKKNEAPVVRSLTTPVNYNKLENIIIGRKDQFIGGPYPKLKQEI